MGTARRSSPGVRRADVDVPRDRLLRILRRLEDDGGGGAVALCRVAAEEVGVTGAGIMLMWDGSPRGSVCSSNDMSTRIEELQYTLGEGPCIDAYRLDRPIGESDLERPAAPRWLAFTEPAIAAGARAVFGFPMQVGAVRLGALNLIRDQRGELTVEQHADALLMASVAARAVLAIQAGSPPGALATELEQQAELRFVVHQAAGMVAAQVGVDVREALIRRRARAVAESRPLGELAEAVVAKRLRFDDDDDEEDEQEGS